MHGWLVRKIGKLALAALGAVAIISGPVPQANAKTLRFAFQGELKAVDPYAINESFSLSVNAAVYEGLIRRGQDMKIEPCLATSWETLDPLHWRFHLRHGVKFHDGQDFT
ncbi:MAG: ABC transporter substrate-binding protein, partial [Hyphomicrobiales bacterium]|nr:ABC transporter substrate-binding protein [Hyphomicrobiales bacterium]